MAANQAKLSFAREATAAGQFFTPEWVAALLIEQYFSELQAGDVFIEPACGLGSFLKAVPAEIRAIGVDIDAGLAQKAREATGREVLAGDFLTVPLPTDVAAVAGNPPFRTKLVWEFIARAHELLRPEGRCGLLLPAYLMQQAERVLDLRERWSVAVDLVPRSVWPARLTTPLVFTVLTKDARRMMIGFALYEAAAGFSNLSPFAKELLRKGRPRRGVWQALIEEALRHCGGTATLGRLYELIEPVRPASNNFWREKIRQTVQRYCEQVTRGEWRLPCPARFEGSAAVAMQ